MKSYKYKFRKKELSRTQVKNNILAVLSKADKSTFEVGKFWYNTANQIGVDLINNNVNLAQSIGVIAALSPLKSWSQNVKLAKEFILNDKRSGHTKLCVGKANKILSLNNPTVEEVVEILRGQKIVNFFLNIYYPNSYDAITIDRHAVGIALIGLDKIKITEEECRPTKKQFEFLVYCYKWAAAELDLSAVQLQAITWEHFRKVKVKR
jgi:hypothetical protein